MVVIFAVAEWIRQHMDDAGQGSRRGEYRPHLGDWVALKESRTATDDTPIEPVGAVVEIHRHGKKRPTTYVLSNGDEVIASEYAYVPMPWEIELRAEAIRNLWTPAERRARDRRSKGRVELQLVIRGQR